MKFFAALLVCISALTAQETNAVVGGDVLDASGAKVPDAVVTALNVKTGVTTNQTSNSSGVYTFASLQPGEYRFSAEKNGFKKLVMDHITLRTADHLTQNLTLEIGTSIETVQVVAESEGVAYLTPTQGSVVNATRVQDLPTVGRSAMDFVTTTPGLVSTGAGINVNGARTDMLNVTLDGINILDNVVNETIQNVQISAMTDRIDEIRVITSPADAEYGRGSGQVIAISRSGTNKYHGNVYNYLRNGDLNANTWANNRTGVPRTFRVENQPGANVGGPIRHNKTFFYGLFEGDFVRLRSNQTATVLTPTARQGIFRFYPGVQNANALAANPVVDLAGNPITPRGATGELQSVNLFGRDPNRLIPDPTGNVAKTLDLLPAPNTYSTGDGLNTAGYQWRAPVQSDTYSITARLDQNFSQVHRAYLSYSRDSNNQPNNYDTSPLPSSKGGSFDDYAMVVSYGLTSTLRPTLVNEFRGGITRATFDFLAPWSVNGAGILPSIGNQPYLLSLGVVTSPYNTGTAEDPQGRLAPVYQYSDKISWLKGIHAIKAGFEIRFTSESNYVAFNVMPRVALGTGNVASQNINTINGIGANATAAQNLLATLSGSVSSITQQLYSPGGANPQFVPGAYNNHWWQSREMSSYVQDDIKLRRNLTLNFGLRWEYYGVPNELQGRMTGFAGGSSNIFGISGTTFNSLFQPGIGGGSLTQFQLIGAHSPNPNIQPFSGNGLNFAPAVGLSWNLPWERFGMRKTVLRAGYGIAYERNQLVLMDQLYGFGQPGLGQGVSIAPSTFTSLAGVGLPLTTTAAPLATIPINDNNATPQTVLIADNGLKTPYIQNWNVSLGREVGKGVVVDVRYVGSKGTKLLRGTNIDEINIFENGILNAFQVTDAGGNSPLLNQIFKGLNVPGVGVVDGVNITGSDAVRRNSSLYALLLNNNVGGFANALAYSTFITGIRGGLLQNGGLPANFVVANPQFGAADLIGNFGNSTYHSLQVEVNKRFGAGFQIQASYVRSKALGDYDGNQQSEVTSFMTLRNGSLDKRLLSFDTPNVWRTSGIWDLPFGRGRKLLGSSHGVLNHLVERWQTAVIFNKLSGGPTTFTNSSGNTFNNLAGATSTLAVGPLPTGSVYFSGNNVAYFKGLTQAPDPSILNMPANLQSNSALLALADANGNIILRNPLPGTMGGLSPTVIHGLGSFTFNMQLTKMITLNQEHGVVLQVRADAINLLNRPIWNTPNLNIDSTSFGLITGAGGNRNVQLGARISF